MGIGVERWRFSLLMFLFMYKFVPLFLATRLGHILPSTHQRLEMNMMDGAIRLALLLVFLYAISRMKDMRRMFQYHGAEHKVVFNFESGQPVNVENAQKFVTFHPRCGTSFLLVVMLIAIPVYAFLPFDGFAAKFIARIALLPLILGVSYELIRFAAKHQQGLMALLTRARPVAAAHHHPAALGRAGRGRDSCARGRHGARKVAGRRVGDRLTRARQDAGACHAIFAKTRRHGSAVRGTDAARWRIRPSSPMATVSQNSQGALRTRRSGGQVSRVQTEPSTTTTKPSSCWRIPTRICGRWPNDEVRRLEPELARIEEELKVLLLPKDPLDEKNIVLEIRAGTGGDEATLFAAEVFRMYTPLCRIAEVARGSHFDQRIGRRRHQGSDRADQRQQSLQPSEVRKRRASRAARAGRPSSRAACTPRPSRWRCCPKPTKWKSRSIPRTSASIRSVLRGPAGSR